MCFKIHRWLMEALTGTTRLWSWCPSYQDGILCGDLQNITPLYVVVSFITEYIRWKLTSHHVHFSSRCLHVPAVHLLHLLGKVWVHTFTNKGLVKFKLIPGICLGPQKYNPCMIYFCRDLPCRPRSPALLESFQVCTYTMSNPLAHCQNP